MKYRLSRSAYFLGGIVIIILALVGFFMPEETRERVDQFSWDLFSPAWVAVDWIKSGTSGIFEEVKTVEEMEARLEELEQENTRLSAESQLIPGLQLENQRLKEMLGFQKNSKYELLACRIIEREPSSWWNRLIVNRGTAHEPDLKPDMPVVGPRGVIGKTGIVSKHTTRIILLVDENCKVSAVTENSRSRGIVEGQTRIQGNDALCRINYIPRGAELAVGERVYTTGLGGTFPANLLIGTIVSAPPLSSDRNFGLYRDAVIKPTSDLNELNEVFIILGLQ
jgi:rod shape-determining protein MreC